MSQMCTYCGKMVMGAHDCKQPEAAQPDQGQPHPRPGVVCTCPLCCPIKYQIQAQQPEQPAPSAGTAREWLTKNFNHGQFDGNKDYILMGYELEELLEAYASQAAPLPDAGLIAKQMCAHCRQGDRAQRCQHEKEAPYWVHTMIGLDDRTEMCSASNLFAAVENLTCAYKKG